MWKPEYNMTRKTRQGRPTAATLRGRWRAFAERNVLAGLTTRGTIPKRRLEQRMILAEVDALAIAIAEDFDKMTPAIKARMLELETRLSAIRKRLL